MYFEIMIDGFAKLEVQEEITDAVKRLDGIEGSRRPDRYTGKWAINIFATARDLPTLTMELFEVVLSGLPEGYKPRHIEIHLPNGRIMLGDQSREDISSILELFESEWSGNR